VVFAVGAFNNDGVASACKADKKSVEVADEAYYAKTGGHAAGSDPLQTLVDAGYLKEKPNGGGKYTISLSAGTVTATGC
jgi:general secretion pathway protein G